MKRRRLVAVILGLVVLVPRVAGACGVAAQVPLNPFVSLAAYGGDETPAWVSPSWATRAF